MKTYTITYRMSIEVEAQSEDEAKENFEYTDLEKGEFVELVSVEENNTK